MRDSWVRGALVLGAAAGVFILERRLRARPHREPWARHTARNLAMAAVAAATVRIVETPLVLPMAALVDQRGWGLTAFIAGPRWLRAVIAIALLDYTLYLWHIATHRVPLLWRFHLVHHVDLDLDATTALRFHGGELALSVPWRLAQVLVIGVAPGVLLLWQSLTLASILFHHSNTALPPSLERVVGWLLVTPRMHAIHHSTDRAQRDRNFSSGLAVWDRLHRTLRLDAQPGEVAIGIPGYLEEEEVTLPRILALPLRTTEASRDTADTKTG
jgi:sterol desaturase/sphingolipid hydroxylase (fatty acid hydroxylase superfamily)